MKKEAQFFKIFITILLFTIASRANGQKEDIYKGPGQIVPYQRVNPKFTLVKDSAFKKQTYADSVICNYYYFSKSASFDKDTFSNSASFVALHFFVDVLFDATVFKQNTNFDCIRFSRDAIFYPSFFLKQVYFFQVQVFGDARFNASIFSGDVRFIQNSFSKTINFTSSSFLKSLLFESDTFSHAIIFNSTKFLCRVLFNNIILKDSSKFIFENSTLPDTLSFFNIQSVKNDIDLTTANFSDTLNHKTSSIRKCNIYLFKSDISKLHIDYTHFKLLFTDPNQISKHYNLSSDEKESIYESLLKNFKDRGQSESAKLLDIEYQAFRWDNKTKFINWFGFFDKWWWNYGYDKEWVFLWALGFIILFSCFTYLFYNKLIQVYSFENVDLSTNKGVGQKMWASFFYTCTIFFPLSLKLKNIQKIRSGWLVYIVIVFIAGLLCVGYMANFILQR